MFILVFYIVYSMKFWSCFFIWGAYENGFPGFVLSFRLQQILGILGWDQELAPAYQSVGMVTPLQESLNKCSEKVNI